MVVRLAVTFLCIPCTVQFKNHAELDLWDFKCTEYMTLYDTLPHSIFFHRLDHQSDGEDVLSFPGKRQLISFLSWLDYVDQLSKEAHKVCTPTQLSQPFN